MTEEERRTLFLQTAARLFETKGYASTSVEDITDELGFSKGVFYYYWNNKREIIQEIHNRALAEVNEQLDRVMATQDSPWDRLEGAIRAHMRSVLQNRSLAAVHLGDFALSEETLQGRRAYTGRFQRLIEEGIAAGVVRDLDPRILAFAVLGLCNNIPKWYDPAGRLGPKQIEDFYMTFIARGLASSPPVSPEE